MNEYIIQIFIPLHLNNVSIFNILYVYIYIYKFESKSFYLGQYNYTSVKF